MKEPKEKKITVLEAVLIAFTKMGKEFSVVSLVDEVRLITERPMLMDGTITKELRNARKDGLIDYEIVNQVKAIYRKLKDWNNPAVKNQLSLF